MIAWLLALPWVRRLGLWLAAAGAFLAALAALRRSGERTGRLQEQLEQEQEAIATAALRQKPLRPFNSIAMVSSAHIPRSKPVRWMIRMKHAAIYCGEIAVSGWNCDQANQKA